jgi:SAM-dependent methyltransferase
VERRDLRNFRGKVSKVIGIDLDDAVLGNASVDQSIFMDSDTRIPLSAGSADLVIAVHTFEHIDRPEDWAAELRRIVQPGGWVCARTPNKWGYIALGARAVPNSGHSTVLKRAQPDRKEIDIFPTRYRLNTPTDVAQAFGPNWLVCSTPYNPGGSYFGRSKAAAVAAQRVSSRLPVAMCTTWHFFLHGSNGLVRGPADVAPRHLNVVELHVRTSRWSGWLRCSRHGVRDRRGPRICEAPSRLNHRGCGVVACRLLPGVVRRGEGRRPCPER